MKRIFLALVLTCVGAAGSITLNGQGPAMPKPPAPPAAKAGLPSCDPDNGGLTLPAGFCALVVHEGASAKAVTSSSMTTATSMSFCGAVRAPSPGQTRSRRAASSDFATRTATAKPMSSARSSATWAVPVSSCGMDISILRATTAHRSLQADARRTEARRTRRKSSSMDLPAGGGHAEKDIAFDNAGNVYVNIGLPSNACQIPDRRPGAPGIDPCPQLEERGGIWRFKADVVGQKFTKEARFATGMRQPVARRVARRPSLCGDEQPRLTRYAVSGEGLHGRRQCGRTDRADAAGRAGRCVRMAVLLSTTRRVNKMILAPEYGGDGKTDRTLLAVQRRRSRISPRTTRLSI